MRRGIDAALREKAGSILALRNQQGEPFKRATYSRSFRRVDDANYEVGFHVDTALLGEMVTERFLLTVRRGSDDTWSVAREELKDTFKGLVRPVRSDRECGRFDTFTFRGEGLEVKATAGSFCKSFMGGKVAGLKIVSGGLGYEYKPPVQKDWTVHQVLKKEKAEDLAFVPERAVISCDPASCERLLTQNFTGLSKTGVEQTDPILQKAIEDDDRDVDKALKENPFAFFRRPYAPDQIYYAIALKKKGLGDHWLTLTHDSYEPKEIAVFVSGLGSTGPLGSAFNAPLYRYHSDATRGSGASPYELETRPDAGRRDFDLFMVNGTVEMGFGDGEVLTGDVTYGMTTKRALRELPFGIARIFQTEEKSELKNPKMTINSLQDGEGNELTWFRTGLYSGLAVLPAEVPAGTKLTVRLQFESKDSIYKLTPSYSRVDRGGWLPFVQFGDMIEDFDLTVRVPVRYKTLGIGRKVSETKDGNAMVTRWVADSPVDFPTIIYGIYVEDTSSFSAKKTDGTEIPVHIHFDKDFMGAYGIAPSALRKFADDAANALNLYREVFGVDYPYGKLDLVNDPVGAFYGQAPSSLIYLGSPTFLSKGTLGSLDGRAGGDTLTKFLDSLVPHEVAHQWWGSTIANANFYNYWFVESLAEYSASIFMENRYGRKAYMDHVASWRKEILEEDSRASVQESYTVWGGPGGFGAYRANLYSKGPYAFHIMRSTWGDEAFFKFLKTLAQELKGKEIVTRDIQRIAEKSFGANLDWFFDQWLRGVGLPEFTFNYSVRAAEDGSQVVEGEVVQRIMMKPAHVVREQLEGQVFKGIVPITITGKSGKEYRKRLIIEGERTPFKFNLPEEPKEIVFNKNGETLAYDVRSNGET